MAVDCDKLEKILVSTSFSGELPYKIKMLMRSLHLVVGRIVAES